MGWFTDLLGTLSNSFKLGRVTLKSPTSSVLEVEGALRLSGTTLDNYVTPAGSTIPTKINIPTQTLSQYGQVVLTGISVYSDPTARVFSFLDARTSPHQPTLAIFSPNEQNIFGFSWEGSDQDCYIKSLAGNVFIRVDTTDIIGFNTSLVSTHVPIHFNEQDSANSPISGWLAVYPKSDHRLYQKDSNGIESKLAIIADIPQSPVNADWNSASGLSQILNKPTLATVATTGSYSDLTNKPASIPNAVTTPALVMCRTLFGGL